MTENKQLDWWGDIQILVKKYNLLDKQDKDIASMSNKYSYSTFPRLIWAKRDIEKRIGSLVEQDPREVILKVSALMEHSKKAA